MKKKIIISILVSTLPFFVILILLIGLIGGSSSPIEPPAEEEIIENYASIASELGVPWDILVLIDTFLANQNGGGIENNNPLNTALHFCIIKEQEYKWKRIDIYNKGKWNLQKTNTYSGYKEIINYLGTTDIKYTDVNELINGIKNVANKKKTPQLKYKVNLLINDDYENVLKIIGFTDEDIEQIMELHKEQYLVHFYGFDSDVAGISNTGDMDLPTVTEGNVTRNDLAKVAASLINHPYLLGGKYPQKGKPTNAIDCSGFVDWVYIQCFGKGVSGSRLPQGVAMSGTALQYYACKGISEKDLKVGDLGFIHDPQTMASGTINHVGIYVGKINGKNAFIHCAGRYYGYAERPRGRVGISVSGGTNSINNITGGTFSPPMNGVTFRHFRRPNFKFKNGE